MLVSCPVILQEARAETERTRQKELVSHWKPNASFALIDQYQLINRKQIPPPVSARQHVLRYARRKEKKAVYLSRRACA